VDILQLDGLCCGYDLTSRVMAEGPGDAEDGASGIGHSTDWLVTGNYFECHGPCRPSFRRRAPGSSAAGPSPALYALI
jgi:hypothetical protein